MVTKIVIVLVALALLVWLVLGSTRRRAKEARPRDPAAAAEAKPATKVEGMVACAHCGVHLPASQALLGQGRPYCCVEHRDGGPGAA